MEEYSVDINKEKAGVTIDSSFPHLMAMDDDILSTGVVLYHIRVRYCHLSYFSLEFENTCFLWKWRVVKVALQRQLSKRKGHKTQVTGQKKQKRIHENEEKNSNVG